MKSCVFSLFTFQMASQFPKRDNRSAEYVWFFVCFISDLSLSQWITNTFWQHHRECSTMDHGSLEVTYRLPWYGCLPPRRRKTFRSVTVCRRIMNPRRTLCNLPTCRTVIRRRVAAVLGQCKVRSARTAWSIALQRDPNIFACRCVLHEHETGTRPPGHFCAIIGWQLPDRKFRTVNSPAQIFITTPTVVEHWVRFQVSFIS